MNMRDIQIDNETLQFIADIKQSSFLKKICQPIEHCIFAYVCGSRLTGLANNNSDIDIVVILEDNYPAYYTGETLKYHINDTKTIKVQWFPLSISNFFQNHGEPLIPAGLITIGLFQFGLFREDFVLFKNEKFNSVYQTFLSNRKQIQLLGAYKFIQRYTQLIDSILQEPNINILYNSYPTLARLCYIADWLELGQIDTSLDILKDIKRRLNLESHQPYIQNRLTWLQQNVKKYSLNIEMTENNLIKIINSSFLG